MPAPLYVPVDGKPWRLSMGLRPLREENWLEVDTGRADELAVKQRLVRDHHAEVVATLPGSEAAGAELLADIVEHLGRYHAGLVDRRQDGRVEEHTLGQVIDAPALHPVDAAGRLVQEDLCLMAREQDAWRLVAASVCFPSRWRLADKIGRDLSAIHGPVPAYEASLARPTAAFFDRLRPERPMWRLNWTLLDRPDLHQPDPEGRRRANAVDDPRRSLWLRVERQTLRRLRSSEGVVFTIRTYVSALGDVVDAHPEVVPALRDTLSTVPEDTLAYKGWSELVAPLVAWLDRDSTRLGGSTARRRSAASD